MSISRIVDDAINEGVYLFIKNGRLAYKTKDGRISDALKQKLRESKLDLESYLAEVLDAGNAKAQESPQIRAVAHSGSVPLSFAQLRLWLIDQIEGGSSQYNLPVALRLSGKLDRGAFQQALDTLVKRHETLRTSFADTASGP